MEGKPDKLHGSATGKNGFRLFMCLVLFSTFKGKGFKAECLK
jgi:hypothetical protein